MTEKEKLLEIIYTYGINAQLKKFNEEFFELIEAIFNYEYEKLDFLNPPSNKKYVVEEMADVLVMLEQFKLYYNIKNEDIKKIMDYKIDRQIKRIEKGIFVK